MQRGGSLSHYNLIIMRSMHEVRGYIAGPANQGGCIIRCVGNLEDEKL
jgi:hypothetical protein